MIDPFDELILLQVATPGLDGTGMTLSEYTALRADIDTVLARPAIDTLNSLTDVTTAGATTGRTLIYVEGGNPPWRPGDPSGAISSVTDGTDTETDVSEIYVRQGLEVALTAEAGRAYLQPHYGGPGSVDTIAHSDHTHTTPTTTPATYSSKGTLSSGPVTLVSTNVVLPAAGAGEAAKIYRVKATLLGTERGQGGSSYYTQSITINGNTRGSIQRQTVGGVPRTYPHTHSQIITGTGAAVTITAALAFSSGDPLTVDAGELVIDVDANR